MLEQMDTLRQLRRSRWRTLGAALLMLVAGFLWRTLPCDAQRSIGVELKAGETYILPAFSKDSTPEVRFSDNPNSFVLECGGPGKCSVIGAEAGHGSIRATLETG